MDTLDNTKYTNFFSATMTLDENDATRFQAETDESSQASDDLSSSESDSDQKPEKSADKTHKEKMEEWASRVEADTFEKWMLQNVVNTGDYQAHVTSNNS